MHQPAGWVLCIDLVAREQTQSGRCNCKCMRVNKYTPTPMAQFPCVGFATVAHDYVGTARANDCTAQVVPCMQAELCRNEVSHGHVLVLLFCSKQPTPRQIYTRPGLTVTSACLSSNRCLGKSHGPAVTDSQKIMCKPGKKVERTRHAHTHTERNQHQQHPNPIGKKRTPRPRASPLTCSAHDGVPTKQSTRAPRPRVSR